MSPPLPQQSAMTTTVPGTLRNSRFQIARGDHRTVVEFKKAHAVGIVAVAGDVKQRYIALFCLRERRADGGERLRAPRVEQHRGLVAFAIHVLVLQEEGNALRGG